MELGWRPRVHGRVGRVGGGVVEEDQIDPDERGEDESCAGRLDEDASDREEGAS